MNPNTVSSTRHSSGGAPTALAREADTAREAITRHAGVSAVMGSVAPARTAAPCARIRVVAAPQLQLRQKLSLRGAFSGTFQLPARQTVGITQQIPYVCCGTYYATDRMYSASGRLLHTARTNWTFA
jgi:hypothetical protein